MRYGRPANILPQTPPTQTSHEDLHAPWQVLILGLAMLVGFFHLTLWQAKAYEPATIPNDTLAVIAMQNVQRPEETTAVAEPFGYYDGAWNLWEYLGDLLLSLLA